MKICINNNHVYRVLACLGFAAALTAGVAQAADTPNSGSLSSWDYGFAKTAAQGGHLEVTLGKMAEQKSSNPAVREFGERMVKDHGDAGKNLEQLAKDKGAFLPVELTAKQQKEVDRLGGLSGAEFDKEYMSLMVKDHKGDEKEFARASEKAKDPDLRAFASSTLTVIQSHLRMAENLDQTLRHQVSSNER